MYSSYTYTCKIRASSKDRPYTLRETAMCWCLQGVRVWCMCGVILLMMKMSTLKVIKELGGAAGKADRPNRARFLINFPYHHTV